MRGFRMTWVLLAGLALLPGLQADQPAIDPALEAAIALYRAEGAETAMLRFQELLQRFEREGDTGNRAEALRYVGECHWQLGQYGAARENLDEALADMRTLGRALGEGKTLNVLGLLEWDEGRYDQAIARFEQASGIAQDLGDRRLAGSTLNNMSLVYDELGEYRTSLAQYQQALEWYDGANFPRGEGDTLGNIGGVNLLLGRYEEALEYYRRALAISESLGSKPSMSLDHGNIGQSLLGLGQTDAAIRHFDSALALARETGMRKEEALWLRGKANALLRKGRYDDGLQLHRNALASYEEIQARGLLLDALLDLGRLHLVLGDAVSAESYFRRALDLARSIGVEQVVTASLLALGDLQFERSDFEQARVLFEQALTRSQGAEELGFQAESRLRLAQVHRQKGAFGSARTEAFEALSIASATGAEPLAAGARFAAAEADRLSGDPQASLAGYAAALDVSGEHTDPELRWQIHYGRAQAMIALGDKAPAVRELEAAAAVIESVRQRLREDRFRTGYVQDKYQVYVELVRLQLELGRVQDAFSTAERLRARSFLEQLEQPGPVPGSDEEHRQEFVLRERVRQLQSELDQERGLLPPERRQAAIDTFSGELQAAEGAYQAFLDDLTRRSPTGLAVRLPAPDEVRSRLGRGEALVEYVVGDDRVMTFLMTVDNLSAITTELNRGQLVSKVKLVRELIQQPTNERWWPPAQSLSQALVGPLLERGDLDGIDHLYLVPHGVLNHLPFALLPLEASENGALMIERFTLSYLPAAATLTRPEDTVAAPRSLLALAPARSRLDNALQEARTITRLYAPDAQLLSGPEATESAFKREAGAFRVLHLSTHGYFNANNPLLSGLELEPDGDNDGLLEVHEILGLDLAAGLVTLSACETGMGSGYFNRIPAGDAFVGLTRAFLVAGSQSVLATLWAVDDRSTVDLMEGFYRRLDRAEDAPVQARALAQVQRELRHSDTHRHPFYWAPFVLVGQHDPAVGTRRG